jgi:ribosome maturation factor RimP
VAPAFFCLVFPGNGAWRAKESEAATVGAEARTDPEIEREIEARVEEMGFELVELDVVGRRDRPIVRARIDLPDSGPGHGVTVQDCARVSRRLEAWLDEHAGVPERYVLEVSSPGVERPLVKRRDFVRFAGREVELKGEAGGPGFKGRVRGTLRGVEDRDAGYDVLIDDAGAGVRRVPREEISRAKLVFRWNED